MIKAYSVHKDKHEIVECICNVFKELSTYGKKKFNFGIMFFVKNLNLIIFKDEMLIELKSIKINETLINEVGRRFRDNLNISHTCNLVKSKIENHGKSLATN